ncbi:MAG: GNAT family N-acetyltransferase [Anaerolineales bacterium]|nr:GNAT family N-acetyltransferase [Anaerolineales bacterium]
MGEFTIHPLEREDRSWVSRMISERWGSEVVVAHGVVYHPADLPGFKAILEGKQVGLITYYIEGRDCGIVSLDSDRSGVGIGSGLIEAVKEVAIEAGCSRLWLITTNDNLKALRFYQRRGFSLVAVHRDAVQRSRQLKPEIPIIGEDGIPIRDEIELEMMLSEKCKSQKVDE